MGGPVDDPLLDACRAAPDDDAPRLVWADAVGGERGELVVIQCDLARGGLAPAEAAARRRRERELLARCGAEWAGLDGFRAKFELRRGFVEAIEMACWEFEKDAEKIFRRAPLLRSLSAVDISTQVEDPMRGVRDLIASPGVRRLRGLYLWEVGYEGTAPGEPSIVNGRGDEAAAHLVESGVLAHLRGIGISSSGLTSAGARHLAESDQLEHLEQLWLRDYLVGGDAVAAVLSRAPRLRSLDLYSVPECEAFMPALPPVTELHLSGLDDRHLAALGRSPAAATIEKLRLTHSVLQRCDGFGAFPRLHTLDLHGTNLVDPDRCARGLGEGLPALRRLQLGSVPASALRLIAHELGPRLEELALAHCPDGTGVLEELARDVAGELAQRTPAPPDAELF